MPQSPASQQLFENIVVDNGLVTPAQLNRAKGSLEKSRANGQRKISLGEVLVDLGLITEAQFESVRAAQHYRETRNEDKRLGRQLVRMKLADPVTIQELLEEQKDHYSNKGATISMVHMLVDQNILTRDQLRRASQELDRRDAMRSKRTARDQGGSIYVVCPACETKLAIKTHNVGKTVKCSKCATRFKTLSQGTPPAKPKPAPRPQHEPEELLSSVSSADNALGDIPDSANLDSDPDLDLVKDDELSDLDDITLDSDALKSDAEEDSGNSDDLDIDDLDFDGLASDDLKSDDIETLESDFDSGIEDVGDDLELVDDLDGPNLESGVDSDEDLTIRSEDIDDLDLDSDIETLEDANDVNGDSDLKIGSDVNLDAIDVAEDSDEVTTDAVLDSDVDIDDLDLNDLDGDLDDDLEESDPDLAVEPDSPETGLDSGPGLSDITSDEDLQIAELASDYDPKSDVESDVEMELEPTLDQQNAEAADDNEEDEALILRSDSEPEDSGSSDSNISSQSSASAEEVDSLSDFEKFVAQRRTNDVAEVFPADAVGVPELDGTAALFGGADEDSGIAQAENYGQPDSETLPALTSSGIYDAAWAANAFDDRPYSSRSSESMRPKRNQADLKPREEELVVVEPKPTPEPEFEPAVAGVRYKPNLKTKHSAAIEHEVQIVQDLGTLLEEISPEPGLEDFLEEHRSPTGASDGLANISAMPVDSLDDFEEIDSLLPDSDAVGFTQKEYSRRFARPRFIPSAPKSPVQTTRAPEAEKPAPEPVIAPVAQTPVERKPERPLTDSELTPPIGLDSEYSYSTRYLGPVDQPLGVNEPSVFDNTPVSPDKITPEPESLPGSFSDEGPDPFAPVETPVEAPVEKATQPPVKAPEITPQITQVETPSSLETSGSDPIVPVVDNLEESSQSNDANATLRVTKPAAPEIKVKPPQPEIQAPPKAPEPAQASEQKPAPKKISDFSEEQLSQAFDKAMKAAWVIFRKELGIDPE